jgi:hypothetical protein
MVQSYVWRVYCEDKHVQLDTITSFPNQSENDTYFVPLPSFFFYLLLLADCALAHHDLIQHSQRC